MIHDSWVEIFILDPMNEEMFNAVNVDDEVDIAMAEMDAVAENFNSNI